MRKTHDMHKIDNRDRNREFTALGAHRITEKPSAGLYVVSTPIGHLSDITLRALEILASVDLILAEDTRHSRRLLDHYAITTPLKSYHDHNAEHALPNALARLAAGDSLALISDAGTPLLSDPGYDLIIAARQAGVSIHPIPGASALLSALVIAGLPTDRFFFEGFLPPKAQARRARLNDLVTIDATLVFYESPQRLAACLKDLATELGARNACIARELTKIYETTIRGPLDQLAQQFTGDEVRGEIVIIVAPPLPKGVMDEACLKKNLADLLKTYSIKDAADILAARFCIQRRKAYALALEVERKKPI